MRSTAKAPLVCLFLLAALATPGAAMHEALANATETVLVMPSMMNISFVKEITVNLGPPELAAQLEDGPPATMQSLLTFLDPIMDFFQSFFPKQDEPPPIHV